MTTVARKRQMQEGEAYGAGSDVAETPLRAEEKSRTVHEMQPGRGRGVDAAEVKQGRPDGLQLLQ